MITDPVVAERIKALMAEFAARINESVGMVQTRCPDREFQAYRLAAGRVLGEILLEILNPLHKTHPDLRPAGLSE